MSKLKKLARRVTALELMVDELHDLLKPQTLAPPAPPVDNAPGAPGCEPFRDVVAEHNARRDSVAVRAPAVAVVKS